MRLLVLLILFSCTTSPTLERAVVKSDPSQNRYPALVATGTTQQNEQYYTWFESLKPAQTSYVPIFQCVFENSLRFRNHQLFVNGSSSRLDYEMFGDFDNTDFLDLAFDYQGRAVDTFGPSLRARMNRLFNSFSSNNFNSYAPLSDTCNTNADESSGACHSVSFAMGDKLLQQNLYESQGYLCPSPNNILIGLSSTELNEVSYYLKQKDYDLESRKGPEPFIEMLFGMPNEILMENISQVLSFNRRDRASYYQRVGHPYYELIRDWRKLSSRIFTDQQYEQISGEPGDKYYPYLNSNHAVKDEREVNATNLLNLINERYGPNSSQDNLGLILEDAIDEKVYNYHVHRVEVVADPAQYDIDIETILPSLHTVHDNLCVDNSSSAACKLATQMISTETGFITDFQDLLKNFYNRSDYTQSYLYQRYRDIGSQYENNQRRDFYNLSQTREFKDLFKNLFVRKYKVVFHYQHFTEFAKGDRAVPRVWNQIDKKDNKATVYLRVVENPQGRLSYEGLIEKTEKVTYSHFGQESKTTSHDGFDFDFLWIPTLQGDKSSSINTDFWTYLKSQCMQISPILEAQAILNNIVEKGSITIGQLRSLQKTFQLVQAHNIIQDRRSKKSEEDILKDYLTGKIYKKDGTPFIVKELSGGNVKTRFLTISDILVN